MARNKEQRKRQQILREQILKQLAHGSEKRASSIAIELGIDTRSAASTMLHMVNEGLIGVRSTDNKTQNGNPERVFFIQEKKYMSMRELTKQIFAFVSECKEWISQRQVRERLCLTETAEEINRILKRLHRQEKIAMLMDDSGRTPYFSSKELSVPMLEQLWPAPKVQLQGTVRKIELIDKIHTQPALTQKRAIGGSYYSSSMIWPATE